MSSDDEGGCCSGCFSFLSTPKSAQELAEAERRKFADPFKKAASNRLKWLKNAKKNPRDKVFSSILSLYAHEDIEEVMRELHSYYDTSEYHVRFYLPQLANFLLHGHVRSPVKELLELFLLDKSEQSIAFAQRLYFFLNAYGSNVGYSSELSGIPSRSPLSGTSRSGSQSDRRNQPASCESTLLRSVEIQGAIAAIRHESAMKLEYLPQLEEYREALGFLDFNKRSDYTRYANPKNMLPIPGSTSAPISGESNFQSNELLSSPSLSETSSLIAHENKHSSHLSIPRGGGINQMSVSASADMARFLSPPAMSGALQNALNEQALESFRRIRANLIAAAEALSNDNKFARRTSFSSNHAYGNTGAYGAVSPSKSLSTSVYGSLSQMALPSPSNSPGSRSGRKDSNGFSSGFLLPNNAGASYGSSSSGNNPNQSTSTTAAVGKVMKNVSNKTSINNSGPLQHAGGAASALAIGAGGIGFFRETIDFIEKLTQISLQIVAVPPLERKKALQLALSALARNTLPASELSLPIGNVNNRILGIHADDSFPFKTAKRAPYLIVFEVIEYRTSSGLPLDSSDSEDDEMGRNRTNLLKFAMKERAAITKKQERKRRILRTRERAGSLTGPAGAMAAAQAAVDIVTDELIDFQERANETAEKWKEEMEHKAKTFQSYVKRKVNQIGSNINANSTTASVGVGPSLLSPRRGGGNTENGYTQLNGDLPRRSTARSPQSSQHSRRDTSSRVPRSHSSGSQLSGRANSGRSGRKGAEKYPNVLANDSSSGSLTNTRSPLIQHDTLQGSGRQSSDEMVINVSTEPAADGVVGQFSTTFDDHDTPLSGFGGNAPITRSSSSRSRSAGAALGPSRSGSGAGTGLRSSRSRLHMDTESDTQSLDLFSESDRQSSVYGEISRLHSRDIPRNPPTSSFERNSSGNGEMPTDGSYRLMASPKRSPQQVPGLELESMRLDQGRDSRPPPDLAASDSPSDDDETADALLQEGPRSASGRAAQALRRALLDDSEDIGLGTDSVSTTARLVGRGLTAKGRRALEAGGARLKELAQPPVQLEDYREVGFELSDRSPANAHAVVNISPPEPEITPHPRVGIREEGSGLSAEAMGQWSLTSPEGHLGSVSGPWGPRSADSTNPNYSGQATSQTNNHSASGRELKHRQMMVAAQASSQDMADTDKDKEEEDREREAERRRLAALGLEVRIPAGLLAESSVFDVSSLRNAIDAPNPTQTLPNTTSEDTLPADRSIMDTSVTSTEDTRLLGSEVVVEVDAEAEPEIAVVFPERWRNKEIRVARTSPFSHYPGWRLIPALVKANDDLRQEQLVSQLLTIFASAFKADGPELWLRPYDILAVSADSGIIEAIPDTISLDALKRGDPQFSSLNGWYERHFGGAGGSKGMERVQRAKMNFARSLAAYSIVCYILQLKDRHNGNILIDRKGHLIHIDFGFLFTNSPGGNFGFEAAPFKLTEEFVQVLGGTKSKLFETYRKLCTRAFLAARKYSDRFELVVRMMMAGNEDLPCFVGGKDAVMRGLRERFRHDIKDDRECIKFVNGLIEQSMASVRTRLYDAYQKLSQGVH